MARFDESPVTAFRRLTGGEEYDKMQFALSERQRALDRQKDLLNQKKSSADRQIEGMTFLDRLLSERAETRAKQEQAGGAQVPAADIQPGRAMGVKEPGTSVISSNIREGLMSGILGGGSTETSVGTQAARMSDVEPRDQQIPGDEGRFAKGAGVYALGQGVNQADPGGGRPDIRVDRRIEPTNFGASRAGIALTALFHVIGKGTQETIIERDVSLTPYEKGMLDQRAKEFRYRNALEVMRNYPGASVTDALDMQLSAVNGDLASGKVSKEKLDRWLGMETRKERYDRLRYGLDKRSADSQERYHDFLIWQTRVQAWGTEWGVYNQLMQQNPQMATMPSFITMLGYAPEGENFKDNGTQMAAALKEANEGGDVSPPEMAHLAARYGATHNRVLKYNVDKIPFWPDNVELGSMDQSEFLLKFDVASGRTPSADRESIIQEFVDAGWAVRAVDQNGNPTIAQVPYKDQEGNVNPTSTFSAQLFNMYAGAKDSPVGDMWRGEFTPGSNAALPMPSLKPPTFPGEKRGAIQRPPPGPQIPPEVADRAAKAKAKQQKLENDVIQAQPAIPENNPHFLIRGLNRIVDMAP